MSEEDEDERVELTVEQALAMLPDGDTVHTFRQIGNILIGANWSRTDAIKFIQKYRVVRYIQAPEMELTGPGRPFGHGMLGFDNQGCAYIESKAETKIARVPQQPTPSKPERIYG